MTTRQRLGRVGIKAELRCFGRTLYEITIERTTLSIPEFVQSHGQLWRWDGWIYADFERYCRLKDGGVIPSISRYGLEPIARYYLSSEDERVEYQLNALCREDSGNAQRCG